MQHREGRPITSEHLLGEFAYALLRRAYPYVHVREKVPQYKHDVASQLSADERERLNARRALRVASVSPISHTVKHL
jgi:hypothetical protein